MSKPEKVDYPQRLRIIGGHYRGRKFQIPSVPGLRPTPDRVRETLFNWLASVVEGARCLEPFAGSGFLGFEALSRGAAEILFVEKELISIREIQKHLSQLQASAVTRVIHSTAEEYLTQTPATPFDIAFLDPPFRHNLIHPVSHILENYGWLAPEAYIYIEAEDDAIIDQLPPTWQVIKAKQAGQVYYFLTRRQSHPVEEV